MKLLCETKVVEFVTKWLQEKASGRSRDCEPPRATGRTVPDGNRAEGMQRQDQQEKHTKNIKTGQVDGHAPMEKDVNVIVVLRPLPLQCLSTEYKRTRKL